MPDKKIINQQLFQELFNDDPAKLKVISDEVLSNDDFLKIIEIFFELYQFDPRYLIPIIKIILTNQSAGTYQVHQISISLNAITSDTHNHYEKDFLSYPLTINPFKLLHNKRKKSAIIDAFSKAELTINPFIFSALLFHESMHGILEQLSSKKLLTHLSLDKGIYEKALYTLPAWPDIVRLAFLHYKNNLDAKAIKMKFVLKLFEKIKKRFGIEYAVLQLYSYYRAILEEVIIRLIEQITTQHIRAMNMSYSHTHPIFQNKEILPDITSESIFRLYHNGALGGYFYTTENLINKIKKIKSPDNLSYMTYHEDCLEYLNNYILELYSYDNFQKTIEDDDYPIEIQSAVTSIGQQLGAQSKIVTQEIADTVYQYLLPYHEIGLACDAVSTALDKIYLDYDSSDLNEGNRDFFGSAKDYLKTHTNWLKHVFGKYIHLVAAQKNKHEMFTVYSLCGEYSDWADRNLNDNETATAYRKHNPLIEKIEQTQNPEEIKALILQNSSEMPSLETIENYLNSKYIDVTTADSNILEKNVLATSSESTIKEFFADSQKYLEAVFNTIDANFLQ